VTAMHEGTPEEVCARLNSDVLGPQLGLSIGRPFSGVSYVIVRRGGEAIGFISYSAVVRVTRDDGPSGLVDLVRWVLENQPLRARWE
jgi:hypothetical protein